MAYDPDLPAHGAPIVSEELRNQLQGLKGEIDARPDRDEVNARIQEETAGHVGAVAALSLTVSNPPTQAQVQAVADKLDELLLALKRQ